MIKALFLDRDGTINIDTGYVYKKEDFEFLDGIFEFALAAQEKGYALIVASNQSGVARGFYSPEEMNLCNAYMKEEFAKHHIDILDIFCATALDENDPDRKPNPGMFLKAIAKYDIDPNSSISIGDSLRDLLASKRAGIEKTILLENTKPQKPLNENEFGSSLVSAKAANLREAIKFLD